MGERYSYNDNELWLLAHMTLSFLVKLLREGWRHVYTSVVHYDYAQQLEAESHRWALWIPVGLALGIACYFHGKEEPSFALYIPIALSIFLLCAFFIFYGQTIARFLAWGMFWATLGFGISMGRTLVVNPRPLLKEIPSVWITGVVKSIAHSASSQRLFQRIILQLEGAPHLPKSVILQIRTSSEALHEGDKIRLKASLYPLPPPCFPGSYNRQFHDFFQGIGAAGFALNTPRILASSHSLLSYWRHTLTRHIHAHLPPPLGAVGCGLVTGDKISLPEALRQDFADSGLAHLLAIAGLHLALLSGLCFFVSRSLLGYIPHLALYINLDAIAALFSLGIGWLYLMISGQRYPIQRAFFMMAATMVAMMISRKRHSLYILMLCAACFLCLQPESLLTISYQLSFVAVAGLISFYEGRSRRQKHRVRKPSQSLYLRWYRKGVAYKWLLKGMQKLWSTMRGSLEASGIITFVTIPVMAFHFYHVSLQGFIGNLLAIPWTAILAMPLAIMSIVSLATPWSDKAFHLWGYSLQGLIWIAQQCAAWLWFLIVPMYPQNVYCFALALLGIFWMLLWQRPWRWIGVVLWVGACVAGHFLRLQPLWFIDTHHHLIGYALNNTLYLSSMRKGRMSAKRWQQAYHFAAIKKMPNMLLYQCQFYTQDARWGIPLGTTHPGAISLDELSPLVSYMIVTGPKMLSSCENRPWCPFARQVNALPSFHVPKNNER